MENFLLLSLSSTQAFVLDTIYFPYAFMVGPFALQTICTVSNLGLDLGG